MSFVSFSDYSFPMSVVKEVYCANLSKPPVSVQTSEDNGTTSIPSISFSQVTNVL